MKTAAHTGCIAPSTYKVVGDMTEAEAAAYAKKNRTSVIMFKADGTDYGWAYSDGRFHRAPAEPVKTTRNVIEG